MQSRISVEDTKVSRNRDLAGIHVLVTRPTTQADGLCDLIRRSGGTPVRFPAIEIHFVDPDAGFARRLQTLGSRDRLLFVSANAVSGLSAACRRLGTDLPGGPRIGAIGPATARALEACGLTPDLVPDEGFTSEALLELEDLQHVAGEKIVVVRGGEGRATLAETLSARGAHVEFLETYRRRLPKAPPAGVLEMLAQGGIDLLTATSGEALGNFLTLAREIPIEDLQRTPIVVGGPRVVRLATERGFASVITATDPGDLAMLEAVRQWGRAR